MEIQAFFVGTGRAASAVQRGLQVLSINDPSLKILPTQLLARGTDLRVVKSSAQFPLLLVTNPHGLHAEALIAGEEGIFKGMAVEKPACVRSAEVEKLKAISKPTAVFHVYRMMWGLQELKKRHAELGEIFSIEGHYLQSSTAARAVSGSNATNWKDDVALNGPSDTLFDIGVHWIDALSFLVDAVPDKISVQRFYQNSPTPHRDSHVHFDAQYQNGLKARATFSKNYHGAQNNFEMRILGTRGSLVWNFARPDEVLWGRGADTQVISRQENSLGSTQAAFHGLGWLEGYVEILKRWLLAVKGEETSPYPTLAENLRVMSLLTKTLENS